MNADTTGEYFNTYADNTKTDSSDLSKVLIGALAGVAVGSLIGGAFTQKGIEVRNQVASSSKDLADNLKHKISDLTGAVAEKYHAAKDGAAELLEKGKQKVRLISSKSDNTVNTDENNETATGWNPSGSEIILGALIVSVASTLVWSFATERGNQTRSRIAKGSKNIANSFKEKVSNVAGTIADGITSTYDAAKEGAVTLLEIDKNKGERVS